MINNYYIRNINGEEVLYLNFNFNYEFSSFNFMAKREKIQEVVRNFIRDNKIAFRGTTVLLVSGGVLFGSVILNTPSFSQVSIENPISYENQEKVLDNISESVINNDVLEETKEVTDDKEEVTIEEKQEKTVLSNVNSSTTEKSSSNNVEISTGDVSAPLTTTSNESKTSIETIVKEEVKVEDPVIKEEIDNNIYVNVNRNDSIVKIELEEYVIGVVGAEMPAAFNVEALKSQAIIARTYALKANSKGQVLSDNESTQSYKSNDQLRSLWESSYDTYFNKVKGAVDSTRGMYLTYNGNYIEAVYHSTSNGRTESSSNVWGNSYPYLVSVDSPYDSGNPSFLKSVSFSYSDISLKLDVIVTSDTIFNINGKTSGDRVSSISVGEVNFTGVEFRNKLGLRSADFDIEKNEDSVIITTRGYGHGVGMSQYGANGMAKAGYGFRDILLHYYPGVSISRL